MERLDARKSLKKDSEGLVVDKSQKERGGTGNYRFRFSEKELK